ncbi:late histone H2A.2.2-like [Tympanuchus pallidicinctus]|uniref:late histone H2A.2.2-like n=1 Tax=Tympanuchus pallidicinctus TaxID=109042 RepID=UPI0022872FA7|nr:late histone H2A.2.2-like [Tympanuchus pallidicinctus]XP_052557712.1 late histone H2A.2.2-like [Tympanuchus pallidicinctus]
MERPMGGSSTPEAEGVCTVPEQKREPEATCSGEPSTSREAKAKKSRSSRSSRAGLLFPVSRTDRQLRRGQFAERFGASAPVYLAAVLQWVTHKTMDVAGRISKKSNQQCISPCHLQMAVKSSSVLKHLLGSGPKRRGRAVPQSQRMASPSKRKQTKRRKRSHRRQAAPARATAAVTVK